MQRLALYLSCTVMNAQVQVAWKPKHSPQAGHYWHLWTPITKFTGLNNWSVDDTWHLCFTMCKLSLFLSILLLIPQGYLTPLSVFILFLWCPYWFCSSFLPHALSSFLLITVSKIRTSSTTSNPQTKQRTPSNPVSTEASPPFSVRFHTQTVTVHMVLPFPRLSFPFQLYPAWLWQHHQTKAGPFMMCNHLHTPFLFLPWLLSSQADTSMYSNTVQRPSSMLDISILSIL